MSNTVATFTGNRFYKAMGTVRLSLALGLAATDEWAGIANVPFS